MFETPYIAAYCLTLAGLLGLVMGSFINCWAWRRMNGESVLEGRSHCTTCGHVLGVRDLVPVASWLASSGRCRYCGQRVSVRYPATELATAAAYAAIVAVHGLSLETIELLAFASILLFLSLTDLDAYLIPNGCIAAAVAVRAIYLAAEWALGVDVSGLLADSLVGAAVLGGGVLALVLVADRVLGRESMGFGDVKLLAVAGFYFGWQQGLFLLIFSCLAGLLMAALTSRSPQPASEDAAASKPIPFGPSIALACVVTMLVGEPFVTWYLSLVL